MNFKLKEFFYVLRGILMDLITVNILGLVIICLVIGMYQITKPVLGPVIKTIQTELK